MEKSKLADGEPEGRREPKGSTEDKDNSPSANRRRLYGGIAAAALIAVAAILLITSGGDGDSASGEPGAPAVVSVDSLREAVSGEEPPVYWAGEKTDTEVELSRPEAGRTYVRYLTGGAQAGDERADFLTVGTYAQAKPVGALKAQGKQPGGVIATAPGGATVYFNRNQPHSVYLAYPGVEAEIEVYDPSFPRALQIVNSGQILPVG